MPSVPAADTLLKAALAPLLVAQGLAVRRRAPALPEAAGPRAGAAGAGAGPALRLLLLGDSSAAGVGAARQDEALAGQLAARMAASHRVSWRLSARARATTADTLERLAAEPAEPADAAVVCLGVNDVTAGVPLGRWLDRQARLRALLRARFGVGTIVISGLPPMGAFPALPQPLRAVMGMTARRYDAALARAVAGEPGVRHLRFAVTLTPELMAEDGFHPGPAGYALWAELLARALREALPAAADAAPPAAPAG